MKLYNIIIALLIIGILTGCQQELQETTTLTTDKSDDTTGIEDYDSLVSDLEEENLDSLEEDLNLDF